MIPIRDVNPTFIRPLVMWAIIAANIGIFGVVQPQESPAADEFVYRTAAIACEITTGHPLDVQEITSGRCIAEPMGNAPFPDKNLWFSLVASMFLHAGIAHILFNLWSLWIFGNNVEEAFGHIGFTLFYLAAGLAATMGFILMRPETTVPMVGASGAIAGVMGAYLVLFPKHLVLTLIFFRVAAIPAVVFLVLWFLSQFLMAGAESSIAWEAHVVGFLFGMAVAVLMRDPLLRRVGAAESRY